MRQLHEQSLGKMDDIYLKVGHYPFLSRGLKDLGLNQYDIRRLHFRGAIIEVGFVVSYSGVKMWRLSDWYVSRLRNKYGVIYCPTGQEKEINEEVCRQKKRRGINHES